jgi:IMP dehydrogenase
LAKDRDFLRGLTFDDVLLKPGFSEVIPQEVDICSQFSSRISLRLPIISAAMDTVTEKEMAIEMALQGGLGIIHKNMSIEKQASQVRSVKRYESVMISDPITVSPNETIGQLKDIMEQYNVSGVPVVDKNRKILGIVTKRDLIFEDDDTIQIKKVMTPRKNLITGSNGISLEEVKKILRKHKVEKLPLVDKDDKLTGLITLRDILKRKEFPEANIDEEGRLYCGASVGVASNTIERAQELIKAGVDCIVIDTAHGHTKKVFEVAKRIRRLSCCW